MEETRATYCFCGCGARITHPRLVVTNTNGWELSGELAEWAKLQILWSHAGRPLSAQFEKNMEDGEGLWRELHAAIHAGVRADREDEARAVFWRKHAKKDRRKLQRQFRRDGIVDPFELPSMTAAELTSWITERTEPAWTVSLDEASDPSEADTSLQPDEVLECPECGEEFDDLSSYTAHWEAAH